jgi:predicted RNA-binding protein with PIN domain
LPQVHLIVDGYNVTKTAWPNSPLHSQRQRLVTALGAIVAQRRVEVTVVFDGAELSGAGPAQLHRAVSGSGVSPAGVIADEVIRQLVAPNRRAVRWWWSPVTVKLPTASSRWCPALAAATLIARIARG